MGAQLSHRPLGGKVTEGEVQLIGFDDDDALAEVLSRFGLFDDYRSFLPVHLTEVLRRQHPNTEIRSVELLATPDCKLGGMPSPDNQDHVIVETLEVRLELRIRVSTSASDLHELVITLTIRAENVHATPRITGDMVVRDHTVLR